MQPLVSKGQFLNMGMLLTNEAVDQYNQAYSTSYTYDTLPENIKEYITLFVLVTLYGWANVKLDGYNSDTIESLKKQIPDGYDGIDATTENEYLKQSVNPDFDPDQFINNRLDTIFEGLGIGIFAYTIGALNQNDGFNIYVPRSQRDNRVRPLHQETDGKALDYRQLNIFMQYGCRCFPVARFKSFAEAKATGYSKY